MTLPASTNPPRHSSETMSPADLIAVLSRLMFHGYSGSFEQPQADLHSLYADAQLVSTLDDQGRAEFLEMADKHHVLVRALQVLEQIAIETHNDLVAEWCQSNLAIERTRIAKAVDAVFPICTALEAAGCPVTVIKSLDHWPDLGSDVDLYTCAAEQDVIPVMQQQFHAELEARSWGDRLAHKWNFKIPGLPELIEIHIRYLGQTGEQRAMARRVIQRRVTRTLNGHRFQVPAPEERIAISTLQRMYRHFYFRLCDMVDFATLLQSGTVNFAELRRAASSGGIWPGTATFLLLVAEYARQYGARVLLPPEVIASACSPDIRVYFAGGFLRVPKGPAASLYGSQLLNAGRHGDLRAICRLPLLPPLAVSALLAYRITGSDKGVW